MAQSGVPAMDVRIIVFLWLVFLCVQCLKFWPHSRVARAALMWIGPRPAPGEPWSRFQLRWAAYSLGWLGQFGLVYLALSVIAGFAPDAVVDAGLDEPFEVLAFALPVGATMALLAMLGFLCKAAKARLFGPDPNWVGAAEGVFVAMDETGAVIHREL